METLKIAFVYDAVYPWIKGGAEKRIHEIGKRLVSKGHEVHWYGVGWWFNGNKRKVIEKDGIILHGVCKPVQLYVNGRRSISEAIYFAAKLFPELVKDKFDIVDCQEFPYFSCFSTKLCAKIRRFKLAITWYEIWQNYWFEYLGKKGLFGKLIENITMKLPDIYIANSEKIKNDLVSAGIHKDLIKVSPNGINLKEFEKIKPSKNKFDVIYAGRLIEHKNVDMLIKSINIVKEKLDITCGIIGDGPERKYLENLVKKLKLTEEITFLGFLEEYKDVIANMKSSKIFVLPSTREGSPITLVEANACGLPVITVNHKNNGTVSLIRENENGFVCDLSPEKIAEKIEYLITNKEELSKMSKSSFDFAKNYDWNIVSDNLIKIYEEVI